uniref:Uncharacterized protein n=1 Tax=Romanomermis culicivorax TaxID=13658 RepID=A0A915I6U8_ROMCU
MLKNKRIQFKGPVILQRAAPRGAGCSILTKKRHRAIPPLKVETKIKETTSCLSIFALIELHGHPNAFEQIIGENLQSVCLSPMDEKHYSALRASTSMKAERAEQSNLYTCFEISQFRKGVTLAKYSLYGEDYIQ